MSTGRPGSTPSCASDTAFGWARKRFARLMKAAGIAGVRPGRRGKTAIRIPGIAPATELVNRDFKPSGPNLLWVADITYLRTGEGWLYRAAVQDAFSRLDRGLVSDHPHPRHAGHRCARDGALPAAAAPGADPPLRPRLAAQAQPVLATVARWREGTSRPDGLALVLVVAS